MSRYYSKTLRAIGLSEHTPTLGDVVNDQDNIVRVYKAYCSSIACCKETPCSKVGALVLTVEGRGNKPTLCPKCNAPLFWETITKEKVRNDKKE